jgi:hypothetical protein
MRCACCKGAAHPASGCQYSERVIICGRCTREAWRWIKGHTNSKGRRKGPNFYDHVKGMDDDAETTRQG